jgi:hypothetical protein
MRRNSTNAESKEIGGPNPLAPNFTPKPTLRMECRRRASRLGDVLQKSGLAITRQLRFHRDGASCQTCIRPRRFEITLPVASRAIATFRNVCASLFHGSTRSCIARRGHRSCPPYVVAGRCFFGTNARNRRGLSIMIWRSTSSGAPAAFSFGKKTVSVFA